MLNAEGVTSQQSLHAYIFSALANIISNYQMKFEVPFRIIVESPIAGVTMRIQKGRDGLVSPSVKNSDQLVFDISIRGVIENGAPNFLGEFAQGPKDGRFVYVNSGTLAGEAISYWTRRAKLSLMSITKDQIEKVLDDPTLVLRTTIHGRGRDGGPVCASVKGLVWEVVKK